MSKFILFLALAVVLVVFTNGCSKESPVENTNNYFIVGDSLTYPTVHPRIVFTNPANGAVGPFGVVDPTQSSSAQRIMIQLNKLVNVQDLKSNTITLMTDSVPCAIRLSDDYQNYPDPSMRNILSYNVLTDYLAARTYNLTIDSSMIDIHGYTLGRTIRVSFMPEPVLRVTYVSPAQSDFDPAFSANQFGNIFVKFNSHFDSTIFGKITISPSINGKWVFLGPASVTSIDSSFVQFSTRDTLLYDTRYTVTVSSSARDAAGLTLSNPYQFSFTTSPFQPRLNSTSGVGSGPGGFRIFTSLGFVFNAPLDTTTIRPNVTMTPALGFTISMDIPTSGPLKGFHINFNTQEFQRSTMYSVQLGTGIRSTKGHNLKQAYSYSFATGP